MTAMSQHDIESENLPAHVSICQERYRALNSRLERVETSIDKIEVLIQDMHAKIDDMRQHHNHKWDHTQLAVISGLFGVCVYLVTQLF